MSFLDSITNNSKKFEDPFVHWELSKPLTAEQINEIINADIANPIEHNLNYDGTRAIDGGEGKFRGGKGIVMDYRVRSKNAWVSVAYTRSKSLPWALDGGNEGGSNYIEVIRKNGDLEKYSVVTGLTLEPEDVVRIHTGNGGGCGKPELRDKSLIEEDLLNEYITLDQAKKFYKYK